MAYAWGYACATVERERWPNRRPAETFDLEVGGKTYAVCVVFYSDGRPAEIFIAGPKIGSAMDAILSDAAILASLALQHGAPPADLAKTMSRIPIDPWGTARLPASPVGAAMDLLAAGLKEPKKPT